MVKEKLRFLPVGCHAQAPVQVESSSRTRRKTGFAIELSFNHFYSKTPASFAELVFEIRNRQRLVLPCFRSQPSMCNCSGHHPLERERRKRGENLELQVDDNITGAGVGQRGVTDKMISKRAHLQHSDDFLEIRLHSGENLKMELDTQLSSKSY